MRIEDYHLLLKLNEIRTIRGTAKASLISQPAVSQRLKFIEKYFNEIIFIRTAKKLILTPSGEVILNHAKIVVEREHELLNQLAKSNATVQGTLSIACSSLISQRFLPSILADYTSRYPHVSIDLTIASSETIKQDDKNDHVCIIRGDKLNEGMCERLFQEPLYIFDTQPFTQNILKERPLINIKGDNSLNDSVDLWLEQQSHIKRSKTIQVDQIETCKQFMIQGLGMAVLPRSVSNSLMVDYPHLPLTLNGENLMSDTWVCYEKGIVNLPQVDEFIKLLRATQYS